MRIGPGNLLIARPFGFFVLRSQGNLDQFIVLHSKFLPKIE